MKFCDRPFKWFSIGEDNKYWTCCSGWLPKSIGTLDEDPLVVWNGQKIQEIRESVLTGKFTFCTEHCPYLSKPAGPVRLVNKVEYKSTELKIPPEVVHLNNDTSCQLQCPQCRHNVHISKDIKSREIQIAEQLLPTAKYLNLCGAGDPLASPSYLNFLQTHQSQDYPNLEVYLHTNGLLVSKLWNTLSLKDSINKIQISIDAASKEVYETIRKGGKWSALRENLLFVSSLKKAGKLKEIHVSFVVQKTNWHEMVAFIDLAKKYNFDIVIFALIRPKGYHDEEYQQHAVHLRHHPNYRDFISFIDRNYSIFDEPMVVGGEVIAEVRKNKLLL